MCEMKLQDEQRYNNVEELELSIHNYVQVEINWNGHFYDLHEGWNDFDNLEDVHLFFIYLEGCRYIVTIYLT